MNTLISLCLTWVLKLARMTLLGERCKQCAFVSPFRSIMPLEHFAGVSGPALTWMPSTLEHRKLRSLLKLLQRTQAHGSRESVHL